MRINSLTLDVIQYCKTSYHRFTSVLIIPHLSEWDQKLGFCLRGNGINKDLKLFFEKYFS